MRRHLIASLTAAGLSLGLATATSAADLPVYTKAKPLPLPPTWTGFYVGGNAGYSWGPWDATSNQKVFNFESTTANPKVNGVIGGLQAGYNWQYNPQWVFGIEGDIQITGEKAKQSWGDPGLPIPPPPAPPDNDFVPRVGGPASLSSQWDFPWFGTARARAGYLATPTSLLYATGGLAFGEAKYKFNFSQPGAAATSAPTSYSLSSSDTRVGFAVGAGAETKLDRNWSVKFEYLYVDLGTASINTTDIDGKPFSVDYHVRDHIARVGLNYSFK
jgi:outer membrane immunogenic protein